MKDPKFFICKRCGNMMELLRDSGAPAACCGEPMTEMRPNTGDGAGEKHVPVFTREGGVIEVQVGSVPHPMLEEHHIGWIWLHTKLGGQRRRLVPPGDEPKAAFTLAGGDEPVAAYGWCNLHGLWKADF